MPVYKDKKTGLWFYKINYTDISGEYRQKKKTGFKTKKAAQDAEHLAASNLNLHSDSNITFSDLVKKYLEFTVNRIKYSSYYSIENLLRLHVTPFFGKKQANNIKSKDIIAWQQGMLTKGYSHKYLTKIHAYLSTVMGFGVKHYRVRENPCLKVGNFQKPAETQKLLSFWTRDEFDIFIAQAEDDVLYKTFFMFLYYTGARKGEAMAVKVHELDTSAGTVNIAHTVSLRSRAGGWSLTTPKTPQSVRQILMPEILVEQLKKYLDYCRGFDGFSDDSFLFGLYRPLSPTTIARRFEDFYNRTTNLKKIRIHDLRHSHASLLINNGASILIVSQRLGHKDINETLNTYSHMYPSKEKEIINIIDNL